MSGESTTEQIVISNFDDAQDYAADYLRTYFMGEPTNDDQALISFLVERAKFLTDLPRFLELGCGPVVNHILPFAPYVSAIDLADLRPDCLSAIRQWVDNKPTSHNWNRFTTYTLQKEGLPQPTKDDICKREEKLRTLIAATSQCDLRQPRPLGHAAQYDAVGCFYTTEQASSTLAEWKSVFRNLTSLVAKGGHLFTCAMGDCDHYVIYDQHGRAKRYPVPKLQVEDFEQALIEAGFPKENQVIRFQPLVGQEQEGVLAVILVHAWGKSS